MVPFAQAMAAIDKIRASVAPDRPSRIPR